jgi:hypothetical protein
MTSTRSRLVLAGAAVVVLAAFIAGGAILLSRQNQPQDTPVNFHQTTTTSSYHMLLAVSPPQSMYTPAEVQSQHPTDGEVMFTGAMTMPPGMSGMTSMTGSSYPPGWYHVEVHVYDRASGRVISDANPVIRIEDDNTGKTVTVPIVTMQGIVSGPPDFHYGNNEQLTAGHDYTLTTIVNGQTGTFHFHL